MEKKEFWKKYSTFCLGWFCDNCDKKVDKLMFFSDKVINSYNHYFGSKKITIKDKGLCENCFINFKPENDCFILDENEKIILKEVLEYYLYENSSSIFDKKSIINLYAKIKKEIK